MRIGLFGGSFNPIHKGHVALGRAMLEKAGLDEVWYMVSPENPLKHGNTDLAPEQMRLRMVEAALKNERCLRASDYEFRLPKPSYTWNTLRHLRMDYPEHTFVLIIGGDNWVHFHRWAHFVEILRDYEVAVYPRRDDSRDTSVPIPIEEEIEKGNIEVNGVTHIEVPLLDVSSTMVRQRIRRGEDITSLIPETVVAEVEKYSLYR